MELLVEAVEHNSHESLLIAFRLHEALYGTVPEQLLLNSHPLAELQHTTLAATKPDAYMSQRIIEIEKLFQREALNCIFDILQGETYLFSCRLPDVFEKLVHSDITLDLKSLDCKSQTNIMNSSPLRTRLLLWAVRLNIHPLVECLVHHTGLHFTSVGDRPDRRLLSGEILSAACEGGHLAMLRWLTQQDFLFMFTSDTVWFHWLTKFPAEEIAAVVEILLVLEGTENKLEYVPFDETGVSQTRQRIFPGPTDDLLACRQSMELGGAHLRGTTLEFALDTNNEPLLRLLLGLIPTIGGENPLSVVGWMETTFDTAISLNLWTLIPTLAAAEKTFRGVAGAKENEVQSRQYEERKTLLPHALSSFGMPDDPILPFLIHGADYEEAVEKTLDTVLSEGLCDINNLNQWGETPLSNFLQFAPCDFTANAARHLISRGARIPPTQENNITRIMEVISKTRSHRTSAELIRTLVEQEALANESSLLATVIRWGNLDAVRMLCGLDCNSHRLRPNFALSELPEDLRATALEIAIHARTNNAEMVKLLLSLKADVNSRPGGVVDGGKWPTSPLERATELFSCDADIIDTLITAGAKPSFHGVTVLGWAVLEANCRVDGEPVIRLLLRYEEIRNLKDSEVPGYGSNLLVACHVGNVDAAFALLDAGADVGDDDNVEFLCEVASNFARDLPVLPPVLHKTALPNYKTVYKWSCQVAKLLRVLRAERQLVHGRTELHFAVETLNFRRIVELVVEDSSLVSLCDDKGRLPVHMLEDAEALEGKAISEGPYLQRVKQARDFLDKWLTYEQESLENKSTPSARVSKDSDKNRRAIRLREHQSLGMEGGVVLLPGQPAPRSVYRNREADLRTRLVPDL